MMPTYLQFGELEARVVARYMARGDFEWRTHMPHDVRTVYLRVYFNDGEVRHRYVCQYGHQHYDELPGDEGLALWLATVGEWMYRGERQGVHLWHDQRNVTALVLQPMKHDVTMEYSGLLYAELEALVV